MDHGGNVLLIFAASLFPLLALVGSGIDMGRGYMAQARLQQACDAGVLAARQRLGTSVAVSGEVPDSVAETGQRFFNINYREGLYSAEDREFEMSLESDYAIKGAASVTLPTSIMGVFGFDELPINVTCLAQMNQSNTDVMMVLDVTGSMSSTNPGDDKNRINTLKDTVRSFFAQMNGSKGTARMRFGFVPYATNVNVGGLLRDEWMTDEWYYQSREWKVASIAIEYRSTDRNWRYLSGSNSEVRQVDWYWASWHGGTYHCNRTLPSDNLRIRETEISSSTSPTVDPVGVRTVKQMQRETDGETYDVVLSGNRCLVQRTKWKDYKESFERVIEPYEEPILKWHYDRLLLNVEDWRDDPSMFPGCIEERDTYEIDDYDNVDLTRALDLDIDLVPTTDPRTQWRPQFPSTVYARYDNRGNYTTRQVVTHDDFYNPYNSNRAHCPPAARNLSEMTSGQLETYLDTLYPSGNTYHDIGILWGARLLSPNGIFAAENADVEGASATARHLIFLTDGETAPTETSYSTYGFEPIDQRRWSKSSGSSLTQTVENRFSFICEETKKRNIMIWVISFGTDANDIMEECAGSDRYYVADDATALEATFSSIADRIGELRIGQ